MANIHNKGKIKTKYTAAAPDGSMLVKGSLNIDTDTAFIAAYKHKGCWIATGVTSEIQNWGDQIFLPAKKAN